MAHPPLILTVDDNHTNLGMLNMMLKDQGYDTRAAASGFEALDLAARETPDLVLLDIVMPALNGIDTCRRLKAMPGFQDVPVIFLTALRTGTDDILRGFDAGAADYITKPFVMAELLARVRTHLNLRMSREALRRSERRYRAVVEDQTELICRFSPDLRISFANPAFRRCFRRVRGKIVGAGMRDFIPEERHAEFTRCLKAMSSEHPLRAMEHPAVDGEGRDRWFHWVFRALPDDGGDIREFQCVGRDVTERVAAEEAYRILVDHSPQGLAIFAGGRIVFANPMMCRVSGHDAEALYALSETEVVDLFAQDADTARMLINRPPAPTQAPDAPRRADAVAAPAGGGARLRLISRDGAVRVLNVQAIATRYRGGRATQFAFTDETRLSELEAILERRGDFGRIIGDSPAMRRVYRLAERFADMDGAVLLFGETGTGKELLAEALHRLSRRAEGPLIRVNCAALSENLLESELFGHARGAFTGAETNRVGRFEAAHGGTLFLDEISELPLHLQAKLLRVLDSGQFDRVGESLPRHSDARIIAATNQDLARRAAAGLFRSDLFYRLKVCAIDLPPLRERGADIRALTSHFTLSLAARHHRAPPEIAEPVFQMLERHGWPGNARELRNAMEYAYALSGGGPISPDHLPPDFLRGAAQAPAADGDSDAARHRRIIEALRWAGGNKSKAARRLGVSRGTLYNQMARLGITAPDWT